MLRSRCLRDQFRHAPFRHGPGPGPRPGPGPKPNPGQLSPAELAAAVERAIRFIALKQEEHAEALAAEVGDYLVVEFYGGDIDYIRYKWRGKQDSLRDIAGPCGIPHQTLRVWLSAAMVRFVLRRRGIETGLHPTKLRDIAQLMDHPDAMAAIARWAEKERLTRLRVLQAVRFWRGWVEDGGDLADLVRDPNGPPTPPGPGPGPGPGPKPEPGRGKRKPRRKDPDARLIDVVSLLREWVEETRLSPADRRRVASAISGLGRLLRSQESGR